jgi:ribulose-5-phosphate 4-epimerase/fuculose-1-phosphate aldolase
MARTTAVPSDVLELGQRLVAGLTVLTNENVLGSSGHVSVRLPDGQGFLINPRFPASLADPDDLCVVSDAGVQQSGRFPMPSETPIHSAVYRARPEVQSVLHCHPRNSVLVGLLDRGFVPIHREAQRFADGVPAFYDSTHIVADDQAHAMVDVLQQRRAAFLVGHGIVIAEESIEHTCTAAIALEQSCEDQLKLMAVGEARPLTEVFGGRVVVKPFKTAGVTYRNWPYRLHRHGLATKEEIKRTIQPPTRLP